jgi:uncharacterized protein YjbJ (UPF0337 family)
MAEHLGGKAKQKAGSATGDKDLKREGQSDQAGKKVKDGIDKVKGMFRKKK